MQAHALMLALLLALVLDHCFGEPPVALHPVVWLGRILDGCGARIAPLPTATAPSSPLVFCRAALVWCVLAGMVLLLAWMLHWAICWYVPPWGAALLLGLLLKPLLAWRMLRTEVLAVEAALAQSLSAGRDRVSSLVSRTTTTLDASAVRESAIESLAENLNDSVVAPIFWFVLLGLPGAALYRFANTADAMWGYPGVHANRDWQWAGKWAARADDVLSWLPARFTALLLWCVARGTVRWHDVLLQARFTPSPNSGWPMAAMALALGVRLGKAGVYLLHPAGREARAQDTQRAVLLAQQAVWLLLPLALLAIGGIHR